MHAIAVATFRGALRFAADIPDPMAAVVYVGRIDEQRAPLPAGVSNAMQHVHVHSRARQCPLSEDATLLRELGIALVSKLEQLSQRTRWPVAREKHKTSSFAMTISKHLPGRRADRL